MYFEPLTKETLSKIRPVLESNLPTSAMMLNIVNLTLTNFNGIEDGICTIYGYDGASDMKTLFIVTAFKSVNNEEFSIIYTNNIVTDEMLEAFTKLFDWSKSNQFAAVPEPFSLQLEEIIKKKGGTVTKGPAADVYMPMEDALKLNLKAGGYISLYFIYHSKIDLQEEFEVDRLTMENASKVKSHWKYGKDEEFMTKIIKSSVSAGVFKRTNGELGSNRTNEDLLSWIVFLPLGTLNALYTSDDYRRKGLARWTLEAGSKWVDEAGFIPICEIEHYNLQSRSLVEKVGFKLIHNVNWMEYKPFNAEAQQ